MLERTNSIKDKVIIITGGSDGIGAAAATKLRSMGATVAIVGRSPEKTKAVATRLGIPYYLADFARLADVRELAVRLKADYPHIDVLANNAGGILESRQLSADGIEKTFQINHLAPFLLTQLLLDTLLASHAVVIATSSRASELFSKYDIADLQMEHDFTPNRAYGNAKLDNILFTKELNRRYGSSGLSAVAFHPGVVATSFGDSWSPMMKLLYTTPLRRLLLTPERGADTLVWLASSTPGTDWKPGEYYTKRKEAKVIPIANDPAIALSLWEQSVALTSSGVLDKR
jgi:NAD(P)-dependent dehydrogenase (short-subunit alcohol dehydrogenase family)